LDAFQQRQSSTLWNHVILLVSSTVRELTEEERNQIMASEEFTRFIEKSSRFMERALCEEDIFKDYIGEDGDDLER
jgi:hypothetical protein